MRKYIAFEIDIPDEFIKSQTEDIYLWSVAKRLQQIPSNVIINNNTHPVKFTGNWEFIDEPGTKHETKEQWERRTGMKLPEYK